MNAIVTRRALLGATAALGVATLPAGTLAGTPEVPPMDADSALAGLIARHRAATDAWETACRHLELARDRAWAAHPPCPDALTATSADVMLYGLVPSGRSRKPDGRARIFFTRDDFDRLRAAGPMTLSVLDEGGGSLRPVPNLAGEARRREIVETFDRWLADRAAVDDRLGLTAAEAVEDPLCITMEDSEAAVEAYVPTTLAGLQAKAAWVLKRPDRADAALAFMRQIAGEAPPPMDAEDADRLQVAA